MFVQFYHLYLGSVSGRDQGCIKGFMETCVWRRELIKERCKINKVVRKEMPHLKKKSAVGWSRRQWWYYLPSNKWIAVHQQDHLQFHNTQHTRSWQKAEQTPGENRFQLTDTTRFTAVNEMLRHTAQAFHYSKVQTEGERESERCKLCKVRNNLKNKRSKVGNREDQGDEKGQQNAGSKQSLQLWFLCRES